MAQEPNIPPIKIGAECKAKVTPILEALEYISRASHPDRGLVGLATIFLHIEKTREALARVKLKDTIGGKEASELYELLDVPSLRNMKTWPDIGAAQDVLARAREAKVKIIDALLNVAVDCECREAKTAYEQLGSAALQTVIEVKGERDGRPRRWTELTGQEEPAPASKADATKSLKELQEEAEELKRRIREKYPEPVPQPWPEELQQWQGRLWYLGDLILKSGREETKREEAIEPKPTREQAEVRGHHERDRMHIWVNDIRNGSTIAEWIDEGAQQMFEDGFFKPYMPGHFGDMGGRQFIDSVLDYCESIDILRKG
jgi:hypothetical protein